MAKKLNSEIKIEELLPSEYLTLSEEEKKIVSIYLLALSSYAVVQVMLQVSLVLLVGLLLWTKSQRWLEITLNLGLIMAYMMT